MPPHESDTTLPLAIEGDLVRDWHKYEYDDLEVGGVYLMQFVLDNLGPGRVENVGIAGYEDTHQKTHLGRVRITIERLG